MATKVDVHPLTEIVWELLKPLKELPDSMRQKRGKLDNYLSLYHKDATEDQAVAMATAWKAAIWVGHCGFCDMDIWVASQGDYRKALNAPCPNCGDVVIPF